MTTEIGSVFFGALASLCHEKPIRSVIETGTYKGTGSTMAVARALRASGRRGWKIDTVEINPGFVAEATENLAPFGMSVAIHQGLSLPSKMLPSIKNIDAFIQEQVGRFPHIYVDHPRDLAAAMYHRESCWPFSVEDVIGKSITEDHCPNLIILDSAGHLGWLEFQRVMDRARREFWLALDDVRHLKHAKSLEFCLSDKRFKLKMETDEKFGSAIFLVTP